VDYRWSRTGQWWFFIFGGMMFGITQMKKQLLKHKIERAKLEHIAVMLSFRPSRQLPISVVREGAHWVCSFETDPDPLKCVTAFGDSPEQATQNFDALWNGAGVFTPDAVEEDEDFPEEF